MAARILLTGATGFLGSHLAARLLSEGNRLTLLARSSAGTSAAERVLRLMDWHGVGEEARSRLQIVEGDLTAPQLGLGGAEIERLRGETEEIVHCASETTFAERRRELLERVNVGGLGRLLELAVQAPRLAAFHQLSTAYVAGRRVGECREEWPDAGTELHNPYEETKRRGELMVRAAFSGSGVRVVVYRPSIVYGDSRTGRSLLFNALYHPLKAMVVLRDSYLEDLRERGGALAREVGVAMTPEGRLNLPLRIEAEGAGIDLVPVDHFADAFSAIRASGSEGVFHLVAGRQTSLEQIVGFASRVFGLSGLQVTPPAQMAAAPRNAIEAAFEKMTAVYRPYMVDGRTFATDHAAPILRAAGLECPTMTYEVLERCLAYALEVDCGARGKA